MPSILRRFRGPMIPKATTHVVAHWPLARTGVLYGVTAR